MIGMVALLGASVVQMPQGGTPPVPQLGRWIAGTAHCGGGAIASGRGRRCASAVAPT
jgi:hypothetical protein